MFTGIIEVLGTVRDSIDEGSGKRLKIATPFLHELKVDQSICHNGVCLTIVGINSDSYEVQVISETLERSNLGLLSEGDEVNLERSLKIGDRLDGHFVYGHVDKVARCSEIQDLQGSWKFTFSYEADDLNITVEKGSICVNGVSLTVCDSSRGQFSVAVIPYTFQNTNFRNFIIGTVVNLEFDVIGKYVRKALSKASMPGIDT